MFSNGEFELRRMSDKDRAQCQRNAEGFVYVIEFSSRIVKVGRDLRKRLAEHEKIGRSHGVSISRSWGSELHVRCEDNEVSLIAFCSDRWPVAGGREYFQGADFDAIVSFAKGLPMERLTEADIAAAEARIAAAPSLIGAFEAAMNQLDQAANENDGHVCAWYVQFQESRAWFEAEYPDGGYAPVHVGRHAWAMLPGRHKAATLDIFFNDYWISLHEEEEEDRRWRASGGYEALVEELRAGPVGAS